MNPDSDQSDTQRLWHTATLASSDSDTQRRGLTLDGDESDIYQEHVMDHYEDPYHRGRCPHSTHAHEDDNPLCGDVVRIEIAVDPTGIVQSAWFDGDGCCISQASASMLVEAVEGKTVEQVKQMQASDMLQLFGPRLTPNRQKCCLLSWRVLQSALYAPVCAAPDRSQSEGTS